MALLGHIFTCQWRSSKVPDHVEKECVSLVRANCSVELKGVLMRDSLSSVIRNGCVKVGRLFTAHSWSFKYI